MKSKVSQFDIFGKSLKNQVISVQENNLIENDGKFCLSKILVHYRWRYNFKVVKEFEDLLLSSPYIIILMLDTARKKNESYMIRKI